MLNDADFSITVKDRKYTLSAENIDDYTVISGTVMEESRFNYIFGAVIPAVVCAVMILLSITVFNVAGKKKEIG